MVTPRLVRLGKASRGLIVLGSMSLLSGCNGAFWGNLVVLAMTVGIFVGTLSLGRSASALRSTDSRSPTESRS